MVERLILCDLKGAVELGQYGKTHPDRVKVFPDVPGVMVVVRELMRSWTQGWTRWQGAAGRVGEVRASSSWLMRPSGDFNESHRLPAPTMKEDYEAQVGTLIRCDGIDSGAAARFGLAATS